MEKLSTQYNLHWSLLRWVTSFMRGRAKVTRVGASVSAPLYLNEGIPQGTKLDPALTFAVMVNDLVQSWGVRIKFVDDLTALEVVPRNSPSLLNVIVDDIHAFAVNNNMRLNPRKCKSMAADFFFTSIVVFRAQSRLVGPILNRSLHLSSSVSIFLRTSLGQCTATT